MAARSQSLWKPLAVDYGHYNPLMVGSIDGTDDRPHDRAITKAVYSQCMLMRERERERERER